MVGAARPVILLAPMASSLAAVPAKVIVSVAASPNVVLPGTFKFVMFNVPKTLKS